MGKPIISLVDLDQSRGGLSLEQVSEQLDAADALYENWGFNLQGNEKSMSGRMLHAHLFMAEPIEWNRIGHFQDVTMRLIAERLLPNTAGKTYVDRELVNQKLKPLPPPQDNKHSNIPASTHHIFCSHLISGGLELMEEVSQKRGFKFLLTDPEKHSTLRAGLGRGVQSAKSVDDAMTTFASINAPNVLRVTTSKSNLARCEHILLYLTSETWTQGEKASASICELLLEAMDLGVHVLLAHEMTGGGQQVRFGCEFGDFFSCSRGATPGELLKAGIYSQIAVPLKGGPWREASMALLGMALGMSKDEVTDAKEGIDVFGILTDSQRQSSAMLTSFASAAANKSLSGGMAVKSGETKMIAVSAAPRGHLSRNTTEPASKADCSAVYSTSAASSSADPSCRV